MGVLVNEGWSKWVADGVGWIDGLVGGVDDLDGRAAWTNFFTLPFAFSYIALSRKTIVLPNRGDGVASIP